MSKGFLVLAQNTDKINYIKQAYALALSIRASQTKYKSISLVTNDRVPKRYQAAFDKIIGIPFKDEAADSRYKVENRWKMIYASPYDETIVLDTDMLVTEDISLWWKILESRDLFFCSRVKNYKQELITQDAYHRKAFIANKLSNPYFALHYFKKSTLAFEFYKVLEFVCKNWEWCWTTFAPENYQPWLSMDLAAAIAIEIMQCHSQVFDPTSPIDFVHMKSPLQGWPTIPESWQNTVTHILNSKGELIIGNIKQSKIVHYVEKDFCSENLINRLESIVNE